MTPSVVAGPIQMFRGYVTCKASAELSCSLSLVQRAEPLSCIIPHDLVHICAPDPRSEELYLGTRD